MRVELFVLLIVLGIVARYRRAGHHRTGTSALAIVARLYAEKHAALERHLSTSWPGTVIGRHHAV